MEGRTNDAGAQKLQDKLADSKQRMAQRQTEMEERCSNMLKKFSDMCAQIIANMK